MTAVIQKINGYEFRLKLKLTVRISKYLVFAKYINLIVLRIIIK